MERNCKFFAEGYVFCYKKAMGNKDECNKNCPNCKISKKKLRRKTS